MAGRTWIFYPNVPYIMHETTEIDEEPVFGGIDHVPFTLCKPLCCTNGSTFGEK